MAETLQPSISLHGRSPPPVDRSDVVFQVVQGLFLHSTTTSSKAVKWPSWCTELGNVRQRQRYADHFNLDFRVPKLKIRDKDELECKLRTKVKLEHLKLELSIKAERMRFLL